MGDAIRGRGSRYERDVKISSCVNGQATDSSKLLARGNYDGLRRRMLARCDNVLGMGRRWCVGENPKKRRKKREHG